MASQLRVLQGALLVLVGALSFVAGRGTAPSGEAAVLRELARLRAAVEAKDASKLPPPEVRCAVAPSPATPVDMAALRAELAQVLREELASRTEGATKPEPQAPPPPSPQAVASHQEGLRLVEAATRARQWREQDASIMRRLLSQMDEAQRTEVMRRLAVAINGGGINVQVSGPPF